MNRNLRTVVILTVVYLLAATCASLWAQAPPAPTRGDRGQGELATQVYVLKHADPNEIARVVSAFVGEVRPVPGLKALTWTGRRELLPAVEEVIHRLDVPPPVSKTIETTFYLLVGSKQGGQESPLPESLRPVTTQLGEMFGFKSFSLRETVLLRTVEGSGGEAASAMPSLAATSPRADELSLRFDKAAVLGLDGARSVRLSKLSARVRSFLEMKSEGDTKLVGVDTEWETSIEVKEGQKAVVGKGSLSGSKDTAFLVVSARIED